MDVSIQQIQELIRQGEGISVEFKTCRNKINRDVYETVCAFLNRHGGTIVIGKQE
ncbi:AlbA family DNA-binding domain-containing protein [Chlorobium phaeobacteroides]|uniref:AlbA family DNA-binding domain-containing protein n=1 Tax=Chlorobium phaeobacteroides TaxID=1096 RepID=UPI00030ABAA5|nr:ATP-binding protein [Chlorobium phaeobacteroides]